MEKLWVRLPVRLSAAQGNLIVRLLGEYQTHLESAIECAVAVGEIQPRDEEDRENVALDRRSWREAEDLLIALTKSRSRGPRGRYARGLSLNRSLIYGRRARA